MTNYFGFTKQSSRKYCYLIRSYECNVPLLAHIPQYTGQELSDDYYNKVMQAINYGNSLGVVGFDNAMKTNVLAGKMAGRFTPPNPFNNTAGNAVNTPALFIA